MLYQVEFTVPAEAGDALAVFLSERIEIGWEEKETKDGILCSVHFEQPDIADRVAAEARAEWSNSEPTVTELQPENWAMAWMDFFVPVSCGERFEVLPPWLKDDANPDLTPIVIEPKMAFGTGHHNTTALCLECIAESFAEKDNAGLRFLDLGTGSGILAIALSQLGLTGMALDIDPEAVECAVENTVTNNVADSVSLAVGSLDCLQQGQTFDVVVANILSGPLIDMAPQMAEVPAKGGTLILSGILTDQAPAVIAAYREQGLAEPVLKISGEWTAIVWAEI